MDTTRVSEQLANFIASDQSTLEQSAGQKSYEHANNILELSLLDWIAVAKAGTTEPVSTIVRDMALSDAGAAESRVFGSSTKLPARAAAMVNGATSHALDYDDTHFMHVGHTSVVVFSAALALSEKLDKSGNDFLHASLIGSEVCCYLGDWLGRSHYEAGFHQTATAGTFGATAAACNLLGLNTKEIAHALGIAATRAAGLTSQFGTMSKPYHAGMAASVGVEAALLASSGFTANPDGIDCSLGFAETHHADSNLNDRRANSLSMLGKNLVFADVQHKLHACCHGIHASIEALEQIKTQENIRAAEISAIRIETNPRWLAVCNKPSPQSGLESKFSYAHVSALVFSQYNTAALTAYGDDVCNDAQLSHIRNKTQAVGNEQLSDTMSRVSVQLQDNRILSAEYDLARHGSKDVRTQKLLNKCEALLGTLDTAALWQAVSSMTENTAQHFSEQIMN